MTDHAAQSAAEDDEERRESADGPTDERPAWRRYAAALGPGLVTGGVR